MHTSITRKHFTTLVKQHLTGQSGETTEGAIAFALDLFARLALQHGLVNANVDDLVGLATGEGDHRVVQMLAPHTALPTRPGKRWAIYTLEVAGESAEALTDAVGRFFEAKVTPRTALVFDIRMHPDLTLHDVSDVVALVYQHTGSHHDVLFGAVGAPAGGERLGLALVALVPIA